MLTNDETILGTLSTGEGVPLMQADRRRHVYVIGMTGTGKTGLQINLMLGDLLSGAGFCFLDPHGDASKHIASLTPPERRQDVIYLDPSRPDDHTFHLQSPFSGVPEAERATAAANIVQSFKNIFASSWGYRLEYILGHSIRLLLDTKDQTLLGLPRLAGRRHLSRLARAPMRRSRRPILLADGIRRVRFPLSQRGHRADPK